MNTIKDSIAWAICICLSLLAVNAAIPQLQMFLNSGRVPISGGLLIPLLLGLLVFTIFLSLRNINSVRIKGLIYGFILSVLSGISILHITLLNNMFSTGVRIFSTFFIPVLILLAISYLEVRVKRRVLRAFILVISIIVIGLGLWQAIVNPYFLPSRSTDGNFEVMSYKFYGELRAFSLFSSPYEYGIFLVFIAITCLQGVMNRGIIYIPALIISIVAIYFTYTRNIYISTVIAFVIMILYSYSIYLKPGFAMIFRSIVYISIFLVSFIIPYIISSASSYFEGGDIYQSGTLDIRLLSWKYWIDKILGEGALNVMFGLGYFQDMDRGRSYVLVGEVIDNQLLSILAGMGVLGVLCWTSLINLTWWRMNRMLEENAYGDKRLSLVGITMFSIWPVMGQFNIISASLFALTSIALMGTPKAKRKFEAKETAYEIDL